jgi:hypothetical protein
LAEVQNGFEGWKFERGDTGDTGHDWPVDGEEIREEDQPSSSSSSVIKK